MLEQLSKDTQNIQKIKCYIEFPYLRNIMPILEELKQNAIEYNIVPIDDKWEMNRPMMRIYINRTDLEKYKEKVHPKISTAEKGIISIGGENIDLGKEITRGCNIPFLQEKRDNQKDQVIYRD